MDKILIVDDNTAVCEALSLLLKLNHFSSISVHTPEEAIKTFQGEAFSLVIQDMNFSADTTSGEEGRSLFYRLRAINPDVPIILLTAWTQLETAVELVRAGAADYLAKPWDDNKLLVTIKNLAELNQLQQENRDLKRRQREREAVFQDKNLCGLVFESAEMQRTLELALQVATSDIPILITGPNGSGKEKIAEIIQANSLVKNKPFVKVNVGALPTQLMEAELFGAEKGAYTGSDNTRIGRFEAAQDGTLFLDEIGNLPMSGQIKLLRVLQTGEFERLGSHKTRQARARIISATNADLKKEVAAGTFREDLYYRLNVIELNVAPLASRKDDILPLARHFLSGHTAFNPQLERALVQHDWPGNVRELENTCKRASILGRDGALTAADFGIDHMQEPSIKSFEPTEEEIQAALSEHNGVISRAAKSLGLSRQSLYRRMEKYDISSS